MEAMQRKLLVQLELITHCFQSSLINTMRLACRQLYNI